MPDVTPPTQSPAERRAALVKCLREGESRAPVWLSLSEERGLQRQAGDDWRAGAEMVDQMVRLSRLEVTYAVDAVEKLAAEAPPDAPFAPWLDGAIAMMEVRRIKAGQYGGRGIAFLVSLMKAFSS